MVLKVYHYATRAVCRASAMTRTRSIFSGEPFGPRGGSVTPAITPWNFEKPAENSGFAFATPWRKRAGPSTDAFFFHFASPASLTPTTNASRASAAARPSLRASSEAAADSDHERRGDSTPCLYESPAVAEFAPHFSVMRASDFISVVGVGVGVEAFYPLGSTARLRSGSSPQSEKRLPRYPSMLCAHLYLTPVDSVSAVRAPKMQIRFS